MKIFHDKYFILCLIVCILLIIFSFSYSSEKNGDSDDFYIVTIDSMTSSSSGFIYDMTDIGGVKIHSYCKNKLEYNGVYEIKGNYSTDGSILFISDFRLCETI